MFLSLINHENYNFFPSRKFVMNLQLKTSVMNVNPSQKLLSLMNKKKIIIFFLKKFVMKNNLSQNL